MPGCHCKLETKPMQIFLPPALNAERIAADGCSGPISYYRSITDMAVNARPLLLIHSINAAASAHEIRPLFEHFCQQRPVYAPDLPGYGFSSRSNRDYTPRLMTDAVHDLLKEIARDFKGVAVDALAVSLSCEFLARAALEAPSAFNTLALVSPTGFNRSSPIIGKPGATRGNLLLHRFLTLPGLGSSLFRLLTSRKSVRFFLQKTWGSKNVDQDMLEYSYLSAHQPGAQHAPFSFLSGFLFSTDINGIYSSLELPVWLSHGVRGDFTDYRLKSFFQARSNWLFQVFDSGALPYFERPTQFQQAYKEFMNRH